MCPVVIGFRVLPVDLCVALTNFYLQILCHPMYINWATSLTLEITWTSFMLSINDFLPNSEIMRFIVYVDS